MPNVAESGFWDTDRPVATVAMETTQLVLSQLKTFQLSNWGLNKVCLCQK